MKISPRSFTLPTLLVHLAFHLSPIAEAQCSRAVATSIPTLDSDRAADLSEPIAFIDHPSFHTPGADSRYLLFIDNGGAPILEEEAKYTPMSSQDQTEWFLRMNYLKLKAERARVLYLRNFFFPDRCQYEHFLREANLVRTFLFLSNHRLIMSFAIRLSIPSLPAEELAGPGAIVLLRAVDRFDVTYGTVFSTLGGSCLYREFARIRQKHLKSRRKEFVIQNDENSDRTSHPVKDLADGYGSELADEHRREDARIAITQLFQLLDERETAILTMRWGLDGSEPRTFKAVSEHFGVSKERIRQIQTKALVKMRANSDSIEFEMSED